MVIKNPEERVNLLWVLLRGDRKSQTVNGETPNTSLNSYFNLLVIPLYTDKGMVFLLSLTFFICSLISKSGGMEDEVFTI